MLTDAIAPRNQRVCTYNRLCALKAETTALWQGDAAATSNIITLGARRLAPSVRVSNHTQTAVYVNYTEAWFQNESILTERIFLEV